MVSGRPVYRSVNSYVAGKGKRKIKVPINVVSSKKPAVSAASSGPGESGADSSDWMDIDEPDECKEEEATASTRTSTANHAKRVRYNNESWIQQAQLLLLSFCSFLKAKAVCNLCQVDLEETYRCRMCGLLNVCRPCLERQHHHQPLHVVERWNGKFFERERAAIRLRNNCGCSQVAKEIKAVFINDEAEDIDVHISLCGCHQLSTIMLSLGYWPIQSNPEKAHVAKAVSIQLLLVIESIRLMTSASLYSVCKAMQFHKSPIWISNSVNIYRLLNSYGSMSAFQRLLDDVKWSGKVECAACFVPTDQSEQENVNQIYKAPVFALLDGCFGLKHRMMAGKEFIRSAIAPFFLDVDVETVTEPNKDHCPNWHAGGRGQSLVSASDVHRLDVFGCFCASCRHGCIRYLADMITPGERYSSCF